ncbi:hypothetical protein KZ829_15485 [Actinoplanes hulinensis]|uniref:Uncharacterized protein n=1 Tax=Actinoplanes hulinensis TaxID=1144547 RepID=A0ABS7B2H7_9ACTN|nr:hypothetical protein [Actinoplanes hulinensis]MBW6435142.1 hypothetical protein [Actinoplanes hulinensis]
MTTALFWRCEIAANHLWIASHDDVAVLNSAFLARAVVLVEILLAAACVAV